MPNVMLYGFDKRFDLRRITGKIEAAVQSINLGEDAVITVVSSKVKFCDGRKTPAPFIRICSTDPEEIKRIIDKLKEIGVNTDVEWQVLNGFIPAIEMR